jgi:hypothetical protein
MQKIYRQGDVLIRCVKTIPADVTPAKSNVLVEGETTGHAHRVANVEDVEIFVSAKGSSLFLKVREDSDGGRVEHEEHATITLPAGQYEVTRQCEYTPEEIRNVAD